jgi:hypothetical protein
MEESMRTLTSTAALAALVLLAGCGQSASAGQNWIFYTYNETVSDGKSTNKYAVQECINIKAITQASYYPPEASNDAEKMTHLWIKVGGKEVNLYGKQADSIWKSLNSNN